MKEYKAQTGGRYTYADDLLNLQNLALAFGSIFGDCLNFIISGCEVSGNNISEGFVYINGKVRKFEGHTGNSTWPKYIYENNSNENIGYANNQTKVGRTNYGCACGPTVPSGNDPVTGAARQSIQIASTGAALRKKNEFFGKNCLLLDPGAAQTVANAVTFSGNVAIGGTLNVTGQTTVGSIKVNAITSTQGTFSITDSNGNINITAGTGKAVNIGPSIKEGGTLLSSKYVQRSELQSWVFGNAPSTGMTQGQCDARYARLTGGLTQFITGDVDTPAQLLAQINGLSMATADGRYAKIESLLADMATTEARKSMIRHNIGAAAAGSFQPVLNDTGWILLKAPGLYVRQWGNIVTIEGAVYAKSNNETVVTMPSNISAPSKDIEVVISGDGASDTPANYQTRLKMQGGSKDLKVAYCHPSLVGSVIKVLITYMN